MKTYSLNRLGDRELLRSLASIVAQDCVTMALMLAHVAEVDERRLYLPAGYPSMYAFCVQNLHMSEDAAYKRIRAARVARRFPAYFAAVAEGRIHLSGVVLLAAHVTTDNAEALLAEATHKTKAEIEELLARRFPQADIPWIVKALPVPAAQTESQLAPEPAAAMGPAPLEMSSSERVPAAPSGSVHPAACTGQLALGPVRTPPKLAPIAPEHFALHVTISRDTHEKLRHAQALLSHSIPSGDLAEVLDRLLDLAVGQLEKRRFAKTEKPRSARPSANPRHIPSHVKRAVCERDGARCTFVGENGHRCDERWFLEFDHIEPVARGGQATVDGVRLRCRAHNQYEAECVFGAGFMNAKRGAARRATEARAPD